MGRGKGYRKMVACLAVCDYLWAVNCIITYSLLLFNYRWSTFDACLILRLSWSSFAMSSIFWNAMITLYLYLVLCGHRLQHITRSWSLWIFSHTVCWGIPPLLSGLTWWLNQIETAGFGVCFPKPEAHLLLWFLPVTFIFIVTFVIYALILYSMNKQYRVLMANHRKEALSKSKVFIWRVFALCLSVPHMLACGHFYVCSQLLCRLYTFYFGLHLFPIATASRCLGCNCLWTGQHSSEETL